MLGCNTSKKCVFIKIKIIMEQKIIVPNQVYNYGIFFLGLKSKHKYIHIHTDK